MMILAASMSMGKVAPVHDLNKDFRRTLDNVDPSLTKDNIVYIDNLHGRSIEDYTNDEMQKYIDEYNTKQKRKDRKINGTYIDYHTQDQNMMKGVKEDEQPEWAYEFVLCYGNHEDYWHEYFNSETPKSRKREMYDQADREYRHMIEQFKKKYPHLEIVYAALHADEPNGSIHLHLCVQPRANEYARGIKTRVSISRALEQDGFEYEHSSTAAKEKGGFQMERLFKDFRHNVMNPRLEQMGYEIKEEEHGVKHLDVPTYKAVMEQADQKLEQAQQQLDFSQIGEQIKQQAEKIINEKDNNLIIDHQYKDSIFAKPRAVAIVPLEVYESQKARQNIGDAIEHIDLQVKRMDAIAAKTINAIESEGRSESEEEIKRLRNTITEKNEQIREQERTIQKLQSKLDAIIEFIAEHHLLHAWQRLWDRIKERTHERKERIL